SSQQLRSVISHSGPVNAVTLLPDGHHAFSSAYDDSVRLWATDNAEEVTDWQSPSAEGTLWAVLADGRRVIYLSAFHFELWDIVGGKKIRAFYPDSKYSYVSANDIAVLPGGRHVITALGDWTLTLWDLVSGHRLKSFIGHSAAVKSVAVLPDG